MGAISLSCFHTVLRHHIVHQMRHIILRTVATRCECQGKTIFDGPADGICQLDTIGHIGQLTCILQSVLQSELMRIAIALQSIAHEGLIKAAIHTAAANNGIKLCGGDANFFGQSQCL